jgi:hypothetical protein
MSFQKRKKKSRKLDILVVMLLKIMLLNYYLMKRENICNILNKENLNEMLKFYFEVKELISDRNFFIFEIVLIENRILLSRIRFFIHNISEIEIDLNMAKKVITPNHVLFPFVFSNDIRMVLKLHSLFQFAEFTC